MKSGKSLRTRPWAVPLVLWLAPAIAFAIVLPATLISDRQSVAPQGGPTYVTVGQRVRDLRADVGAAIKVTPAKNVTISTAGTITSIAVPIGSTVAQAQSLLTVNGVQVLAEVGGTPLYRALKQGDRGPDVATLNSLLAARGYPVHSDNAVFDRSTALAVRQLRVAVGASANSTFDPSFIVHFPAGAVISIVSVDVGSMVSPGSTVFQLEGEVVKASLQPGDDTTALTQFGNAPVTVSVGNSNVALSSAQATSDSDKASLAAFLSARLADGTLTVDNSGKATGLSLALQKPDRVGTVPIAAVLATAAGHLCVYVRSDRKLTAVPIVKPVPSSEVGVAYVDPSLVGQKVFSQAADLTSDERRLCT